MDGTPLSEPRGESGPARLTIRRARAGDAEQICRVHVASIRRFCSAAYPAGQIEEWTGLLAPDRYLESIETLEFVVAELDQRVEGFCILNLETGELHALYLSPFAAGRGHGRALMAWAEETARSRGFAELFLKATLNAAPFYSKCGFVTGRAASSPLPSGAERACVEMRKTLRAE